MAPRVRGDEGLLMAVIPLPRKAFGFGVSCLQPQARFRSVVKIDAGNLKLLDSEKEQRHGRDEQRLSTDKLVASHNKDTYSVREGLSATGLGWRYCT